MDDAVILHYLLKYKIREKSTVIFPVDALGKVMDVLKKNCINFTVLNDVSYKFINNNYNQIKYKAYESLERELRVDFIVKKINELDDKRLDNLLVYLENYNYEK